LALTQYQDQPALFQGQPAKITHHPVNIRFWRDHRHSYEAIQNITMRLTRNSYCHGLSFWLRTY